MGTIVFFDKAKYELMTGGMNLSATVRCAILSAGFSPSIDISDYANSISSFVCSQLSGNAQAVKRVGVGSVTLSGTNIVDFDLSDIIFTASSGLDLSAQYAVLLQSGVNAPLAYMELTSSPGVAHEIQIVWP